MPILAAEPAVYPEGLLEQPELGREQDRVWWALQTAPRQEKELMRRLRVMEVAFYTPLIPRRNRSRTGRVRTAHVPLFGGYVFMYGAENQRYRAMTTNRVIRWLAVPDQAELTHDLRQMSRLIASGAPLTPTERMEPGTAVLISGGPLAGLEGKIARRGQRSTFWVEVHFLQRGASAEVEAWMIEPLDNALQVAAADAPGD